MSSECSAGRSASGVSVLRDRRRTVEYSLRSARSAETHRLQPSESSAGRSRIKRPGAKYHTTGPPHPQWTLGTLLFTRGLGMLLAFMYRFGLPQPDGASAWKVPLGARRKGCGVECRKVVGIPPEEEDELRIGWLRQESVQVVDVPGFMIWPEPTTPSSSSTTTTASASASAAGKGYTAAQPGEKIIYYLVGGGFISGHPLRTHLAWWTAQQLGVRVFGKCCFFPLWFGCFL